MKFPNPEMLLRIGQADAYAAATEYIKLPADQDTYDQALKFEGFVSHPRHKLSLGRYTDDTQMSIAVSEVLVNGLEPSPINFANAFVNCFRRDPRLGYSPNFQKFLAGVKTGQEFLEKINPTSEKNGAAMRSVPIGVFKDPKQILEIAAVQASLTHNTPIGIFTSQSVALMSHFAMHHDEPFNSMIEYCASHLPPFRFFANEFGEKVSSSLKTIHAVVQLLQTQSDLMSMLKQAIVWGGDTDSVAAITWGIASARMKDELPDFLHYNLEPGRKYGVEYLQELGTKLMAVQ